MPEREPDASFGPAPVADLLLIPFARYEVVLLVAQRRDPATYVAVCWSKTK